jgi:pimeloyl-ACP methyl ester carboxylesterase
VDGPEDGPVVLLVHGATVPEWEFDRLRPHLVQAGYRTVSPDLFGHGYSDRPLARHDLDFFSRQLVELLDTLGATRPVRLVGHSLGAAVGARLACEHPARVDRLVLAAPLLDFIANAPWARALSIPRVGERVARLYAVPMLVRRRTRLYRHIEDGRFVRLFRQQLLKPGFDRTLVALFRDGALADQSELYRRFSETGHPALLVWGENDSILPSAQRKALQRLIPHASCRSFEDASHSLLLRHAGQVAPAILDFLA